MDSLLTPVAAAARIRGADVYDQFMVDDGLGRSSGPPLVSIGIPVRNGAEFLAEALESVLAQDYAHFEVVICDNDSGDATADIARYYAAGDPRIRYLHNGSDLGFLGNFKRVLEESHGTYFTWLAHDDLLLHPSYVSTLVAYLQSHRDVVACSTAFQLSAFELAASPEIKSFPELAPARWPASRSELFRWPHGWIDLTIYGMFRREALAGVPIRERYYKGRPHIFWWETDLLTELSGAGRVVALPECMRFYRRLTSSAGTKVVSEVSTYDLFRLGLAIKAILLSRALHLPVPLRERLPLLATTFGNLFRANLRQPYDHRRETRALEEQVALLKRVEKERAALIRLLDRVIGERRQEIAARGLEAPPEEPVGEAPPLPERGPRRPRGQGSWRSFFEPPKESQIRYYQDLGGRLQQLRERCEFQERAIDQLHSEAAALLEVLERERRGAAGPLVTVGMPVYNGEEYLAAAIESVLFQDCRDLELLIVDNASEDRTAAIARSYADRDPRIRYVRNEENIGFLPNFRRALDLAEGRYFTWLAHDDELSDPSYLSTVTGYLEQNPDVVCCHTAFFLLDNEVPGSRQVMSFPEIAPGRSWPEARRALFRWPHGWLDSTVYGVFRREELAAVPFPEWTYKGRPHIFCWEMDVLTALSAAGRIVALPECLRSYRLSSVSVGKKIGESVSSFDLLVLGMRMKLILIRRALQMPGGRLDRGLLVATVLANLFRANLRQPYDHRTVLAQREKELSLLEKTAAERARLIDFLQSEIAARHRIVVDKGLVGEQDEAPRTAPELPQAPAVQPFDGGRNLMTDFFTPLTENQVRRLYELNEKIGRLREVCEQQAAAIETLTAEADHWLQRMHSPR
ncbi:MAG TPA: glycosyltransferase [Actinomycetota bacterium]|nr:glycosyltransferase [Actinomycetota bacterium]